MPDRDILLARLDQAVSQFLQTLSDLPDPELPVCDGWSARDILGHRKIAVISGPASTSTAIERVNGYCLALRNAGIPIDESLIRQGEFRLRTGLEMTEKLLAENSGLTAIVATNNLIAMGVIQALRPRGLSVPQDIALVCFNELPDLARFFPFLTVIVQPEYQMGYEAARLLLKRIGSSEITEPQEIILPTRMVLRHSCGRHLGSPAADSPSFLPLTDHSESVPVEPLPGAQVQNSK